MNPYRQDPARTLGQKAKGLVCQLVGHAPIEGTKERTETPITVELVGFEQRRLMPGFMVTDVFTGQCERCGATCVRTEVHHRLA